MTTRRLSLVLSAAISLGSATVWAQPAAYQPPPAGQPVYAPPPGPPPAAYPAQPVYAPAAAAPERVIPNNVEQATDHDSVIGHWGFEAFSLPSLFTAATPQVGCAAGPAGCSVGLNAAGARLWTTRNMAFNIDLALGLGSGKVGTATADTYFGLGPAGGAAFLVGNWKHLAVSFAPQGAFVFFTPGGKDAKSAILFNARFMMEAEMHLGFMGLPGVSLALNSGLVFNFFNQSDRLRIWNFGMGGPNTLLGALGGFYLRYYM